ncbi:hypothetical protein XCR1_970036 [Xenorhabdus cabanillasii JM26]|uniref:Uncharacterized protein n=1 Tax=Xenorhabdus cabanillasii JM26 TaxID=1427517 RepID=W1JCW3_9GAMM|nr:hypothetical protein XCR1_970036 [Xenorhabdus cabanillasii JM26]
MSSNLFSIVKIYGRKDIESIDRSTTDICIDTTKNITQLITI